MKTIVIALLFATVSIFAAPKIETIAGTGKAGFSGDGGPALQAELNNPYGLVVGPGGALFLCDMGNHRIRKIDKKGIITTVAGSGVKGWSGDGGSALAATLNEPYEVRFDNRGNMFFVEMRNAIVRRVDAKTGIISTIAGTGRPGFSGDGGAATNAALNQPHSIQFVADQLWICDIGNHRIRAVELKSGLIKTVGGTGQAAPTRDGELLLNNPLKGPRALDSNGSQIVLALREGNAIYSIDPRSVRLTRIAGNGSKGFSTNSTPASEASLSGPKGITIGGDCVYWADTESHTIRYVENGLVKTLAGTGKPGELARPHGVFAQGNEYLWIGDSENHRVRRVKLR
jgi:streptogramin lyase